MKACLRRRGLAAWAVCIALCFSVDVAHAELRGVVVGIVDGDTVDVLADGREVRVRLAQIDAPERRQPFGTRARQQLAALAFRHPVVVVEAGSDRYGRVIGTLFVDRANVNNAMVAAGMAWAYRQYVTDPAVLVLEQRARTARTGLWADPAPVPPWEWRRR